MRHLKNGNRLGKTTSHRRSMMRNMVTSILEKGQIKCTLARAKEVRKPLEKMITWGKRGDLHSRRLALRFVKSKEAMKNLFEDLPERYKNRQGGYSRIIKLGKRRLGDNSEMAIVQLLGSDKDTLSSIKSQSHKKKKVTSILKEVSEDVNAEKKENLNKEKPVKEEAQQNLEVNEPDKDEKKENLNKEKPVKEETQQNLEVNEPDKDEKINE